MATSRVGAFREHKDHYFSHGEHSPLDEAQRRHFTGLPYFEENPALSFVLPVDSAGPDAGQRVMLETTDGSHQPFVRWGRVTFSVGDTPVTLSVFKDVERGRHFLPFRDATAGRETYLVGRYLDPQERPDGRLVVDFNYSYNPYCAYGAGWSCPIPPAENVIPVRIEAGEKVYNKTGEQTD